VEKGTVERRRLGRECRYRIIPTPEPGIPEHRNHTGNGQRNTGTNSGTDTGTLALAPIPDAQPAPAPALIRLVEQLTADFATAERERGEAIGIGFMLAEQREQLTLERENLAGQLAELRSSAH